MITTLLFTLYMLLVPTPQRTLTDTQLQPTVQTKAIQRASGVQNAADPTKINPDAVIRL